MPPHKLLIVPTYILSWKLVLELVDLALGVVNDALALIDGLNELPLFLVLFGVLFSVAHHVLNLLLAQTTRRLDYNCRKIKFALITEIACLTFPL